MFDNLKGRGKARRAERKAIKKEVRSSGLKGKDKRVAKRAALKPVRKRQRQEIVKNVKTTIGEAAFAPLKLLRKPMIKILRDRGVNVSDQVKIADLATLFRANVLKPSKKSKYDDPDWHRDHPAMHTTLYDVSNYDEQSKNSIVGDVVEIVNEIVDFFKNKKEKVDAVIAESEKEGVGLKQAAKAIGVKIDEEDVIAADGLAEATGDDAPEKPDGDEDSEFDFTKIAIAIVALIAIVFLIKKFA